MVWCAAAPPWCAAAPPWCDIPIRLTITVWSTSAIENKRFILNRFAGDFHLVRIEGIAVVVI